MNIAILTGRLTKDPDVRANGEMTIARYTLAVDRRTSKNADGNGNADFISCVAFGKNGEFAEKYLHRGTKIAITGHIQTGSYTNKDGNKVYATDVVADHQEFCESKSAQQQNTFIPSVDPAASSPAQGNTFAQGFMSIPGGIEEELPFT